MGDKSPKSKNKDKKQSDHKKADGQAAHDKKHAPAPVVAPPKGKKG